MRVFVLWLERNIGWGDVGEMADDEVYRLFYPERHVRESAFEADWEYVHKEMARVGVSLRLLKASTGRGAAEPARWPWATRSSAATTAAGRSPTASRSASSTRPASPARWTGGATLGEVSTRSRRGIQGLLVRRRAAGSARGLLRADAGHEGAGHRLRCHVHMYEFWGGVPERTVCDNLKTGVTKHPREGEIVLNDAYEALGEHYMTAIMPAQVRKPKQKASAEETVRDAATWVIAQLRDRAFADLDEAVLAVRECNAAYNAHPFQKREGSRDSVFAEVEAAELRPLPDVRYDVAEWVYNRSVNLDFHVVYAKNPSRCPALRRTQGRSAGRRVHAVNLPRRRAHRHPPSCCRHTSRTATPPTRRTCPRRS